MKQQNALVLFLKVLFASLLLSSLLLIPTIGSALIDSPEIPNDAIELNGHFYKAYESRLTWDNAKAFCNSIGGHLMTITSAEEQALLHRLALDPQKNYWIGATDEMQKGNWRWITGEQWSFAAWGNPKQDISDVKDFLQICPRQGYQWYSTANCQEATTNGFICEWEKWVPVTAPTTLYVTQISTKKIKLTWQGATNAKTYEVYRSKSRNSGYERIGKTKKEYFTDDDFKNGEIYYYTVKAVNGTNYAYTYKVIAYPTKQRIKITEAVYDKETDKINLSWKKVPNAKGYDIWEKRPDQDHFVSVYGTGPDTCNMTWNVNGGDGKYQYYIIPKADCFRFQQSKTKSVKVIRIQYRALLIGETYVGSPASNLKPLEGNNHNMDATEKMLHHLTSTSYETKPLLNPTKDDIITAINSVFIKADDNDVTLFYFTGHGKGSKPLGALFGYDGEYISAKELRNKLDNYKGKKVIILDSCYSGAMINKGNKSDLQQHNAAFIQAFSSPGQKGANNLAGNNYFVITGCKSTQETMTFYDDDDYNLIFNVFTEAFLKGCGWNGTGSVSHDHLFADTNNDNRVTFREAYSYCFKDVNDFETSYNNRFAAEIAAGDRKPINMDVRAYPSNSAEVFWGRE